MFILSIANRIDLNKLQSSNLTNAWIAVNLKLMIEIVQYVASTVNSRKIIATVNNNK